MDNSSSFISQLGESFLANMREVVRQSKIAASATNTLNTSHDQLCTMKPSTDTFKASSQEAQSAGFVDNFLKQLGTTTTKSHPSLLQPDDKPNDKHKTTVPSSENNDSTKPLQEDEIVQIPLPITPVRAPAVAVTPGSSPLAPLRPFTSHESSPASENQLTTSQRKKLEHRHLQNIHVEEFVLGNSEEESPVIIFINRVCDIIAKERQQDQGQNSAILNCERQPHHSSGDISSNSFAHEDYILPEKFALRMIKCKPKTALQHSKTQWRKCRLPPKDEIRLDVDVFVPAEEELETNTFDILKGRHPKVAIPLHPLWQNAADLELIRQGKKVIIPTVLNTGRQWKHDVLVDERNHDDLDWTNKIQHPKTEADLDAHGCFLYMNPDNVTDLSLWLDNVVNLALEDPCRVDIDTEEFRSGRCSTTGLPRPYFPFPQELSTDDFYAPPQQAPIFDLIEHPEEQGFDPMESHDEHMPWTAQDSSKSACLRYYSFLDRQYKLLKMQKALRRAEKKRALKEAMEYEPTHYEPIHLNPFRANPDSIIKPGLAMYVRPATHDDSEALLSLLQHWATETNSIVDPSHATTEHIANILTTTTDAGLPFFVACLNKSPRTKRKTHGTRVHKEQVIGTAYVLPWSSFSTFHSTYETFIYTSPHPSYQGNAVGTTLLDRLLTALDLNHTPQFPTRCFDNGLPAPTFECGGMRGTVPARKLLVNIYYTNTETLDMLWKRNWLEKWGWHVNGLMSDVGKGRNSTELHLLIMGYDIGWCLGKERERMEGLTWRQWGIIGEERDDGEEEKGEKESREE